MRARGCRAIFIDNIAFSRDIKISRATDEKRAATRISGAGDVPI
jgi:hypothetical protein